jgi:diaminohydroxyphosphoribosylaminopyrimidine deaminase/5-amino-6-(5-phosphoribosylamino)uracil reductase
VKAEAQEFDLRMIRRCLELAERGRGFTRTNPMVGCVVVKEGRIISEGWHAAFGASHAEVMALEALPPDQREGTTVYVNLEPCCHYGKTPPCTDLFLRSRPEKVVVAHTDPDARVAGRGVEILRRAGIQVTVGVGEAEALTLNQAYLVNKLLGRPFITLKWAQSADGFIAGEGGQPVKITSPRADVFGHWLRHAHDAIWVGFKTILNDNPQLTVRHITGKKPLRVVWDPEAALPRHLNVLSDEEPALILNTQLNRQEGLKEWLCVSGPEEGLRRLLERHVGSILVEGGRKTHDFFLACNLWDALCVFRATNVIIGKGISAPSIPTGIRPWFWHGNDVILETYRNEPLPLRVAY